MQTAHQNLFTPSTGTRGSNRIIKAMHGGKSVTVDQNTKLSHLEKKMARENAAKMKE